MKGNKSSDNLNRGVIMLGERLKELRGKRTQDDIAAILNISRARYSHYENGRSEPDINTLILLADFYHVTVDYLLERSNDKQNMIIASPTHEQIKRAEEWKEFADKYNLSLDELKELTFYVIKIKELMSK